MSDIICDILNVGDGDTSFYKEVCGSKPYGDLIISTKKKNVVDICQDAWVRAFAIYAKK